MGTTGSANMCRAPICFALTETNLETASLTSYDPIVPDVNPTLRRPRRHGILIAPDRTHLIVSEDEPGPSDSTPAELHAGESWCEGVPVTTKAGREAAGWSIEWLDVDEESGSIETMGDLIAAGWVGGDP